MRWSARRQNTSAEVRAVNVEGSRPRVQPLPLPRAQTRVSSSGAGPFASSQAAKHVERERPQILCRPPHRRQQRHTVGDARSIDVADQTRQPIGRACIVHRRAGPQRPKVARHRNRDVEDHRDVTSVRADSSPVAARALQVRGGEPNHGTTARRQLADVVAHLICHEKSHPTDARGAERRRRWLRSGRVHRNAWASATLRRDRSQGCEHSRWTTLTSVSRSRSRDAVSISSPIFSAAQRAGCRKVSSL